MSGTRATRVRDETPCAVFDLTIKSDPNVTKDNVKSWFRDIAKKWVFQLEKGERTGYLHFQCRISLKVKTRLSTLVSKIPENFKLHASVTSNGGKNHDFYVMKDETRVEGPWKDTDAIPVSERMHLVPNWIARTLGIERPFDGMDPQTATFLDSLPFRPWQKSIIDFCKPEADNRKIPVVIDFKGDNGKSWLTTLLCTLGIVTLISFSNDTKDVSRAVMDRPKSKIYFVDLPKATDKKSIHGFIAAIEEIKNGRAYDDRYHFQEAHFNPPHVWIFTNSVPPTELLTANRWEFWTINSRMELVPFCENVPNLSSVYPVYPPAELRLNIVNPQSQV